MYILCLTIKQAQLYSSLNVYIGHSCFINSFKSEQLRKVYPEKKWLIQGPKKYFDQSKASRSHQINMFRIKLKFFLYKQGTSYILHVCYCIRFTIKNVLLEQCENENRKIKFKTFSLNSMPCSFRISATKEIIYNCRNIEWNYTFWTFQINISNSSCNSQ